jgi:hypothetical protein
MILHNIQVTGSLVLNGVDLNDVTGSEVSVAALNEFTSSYNTGSFTGSFIGDGSGVFGIVSASHALNADNTISSSYASEANVAALAAKLTPGAEIGGVLFDGSSNINLPGVNTTGNQDTTGNASTATSASHALNADNAISSSFAATASFADSFTVAGEIVAQTLNVQQVTSSVVYSSGSNVFGNDISNTQQFTGSLQVSGSTHYLLGNVGIGTTGPNSKLEVNVAGTYDTGTTGFRLTHSENTKYFGFLKLQTPAGDPIMSLGTYDDGSTFDTLFIKNGNIGIGTDSPTTKLDIRGASNTDVVLKVKSNGTAAPYIRADLSLSNYGGFALDYDSTNYWYIGSINGDITNRLSIYSSGGAERVNITSTGNVGINTTSPAAKLDVRGTATDGQELLRIESDGNVADGGYHWMSSAIASSQTTNASMIHLIGVKEDAKNAGYFGFHYAGDGSNDNYLKFGGYAADNLMVIKMSGNVGIGNTSPQNYNGYTVLHIGSASSTGLIKLGTSSTADGPEIFTNSSNNITFNTNSTDTRVTILGSNGNVGIGTTSPGNQLHISGTGVTRGLKITATSTSQYAEIHLAGDSREYRIGVGGSATSSGYANSWYVYDNNATAARILVNSSGQVGIGTTTPNGLLSLGTSVADNKLYLYDGTSDKYGFGIRSSQFMIYSGAGGATTGGITFGKFDGTTFTENVRFTNAGNVGIGTTSPSNLLTVGANSHTSPSDTNRILNWYSVGSELGNSVIPIVVGNNNSSTSQPQMVGLSLFNNNASNNTWSPAITFGGLSTSGEYMNGAAGIAAQLPANSDNNFRGGNLVFYTSGVGAVKGLIENMRIQHDGNIGIGTSSPGSKLTVQGSTAGATVLDIQGTSGQLFSVTDDLTGTLFAVSDISGIPILSVDASGVVNVDGTLTVNDEDIFDIDPYAVGSTLLCARYDFQNAYASFGTVSGNALFPANVGYSPVVQLDQAISLSGTWRARGYETTGDGTATLYQRIY